MNKILSLGARVACALLFTGAMACASTDGQSDPVSTGESADELSLTRPSFVTLRQDMRKCMAPLCGGFFVRDVNVAGAERYVSGLDLSQSRLPEDAREDIRSAPPGELVLYGYLGSLEREFQTRKLVVLEGFRGMPGVTPRTSDSFYQVHARKDPIACFVAPCPNEIASLLNTSIEEAFDRVSVDHAALPWVDKGWLASRVTTHDAIAAGTLSPGEHFPGGYEQVLDSSQVFVRLPDTLGPCLERPPLRCPEGTVGVHQRTVDRCIVQVACVQPGICPQYMPACPAGYTLSSWSAPPSGCPAFACDPSFILE